MKVFLAPPTGGALQHIATLPLFWVTIITMMLMIKFEEADLIMIMMMMIMMMMMMTVIMMMTVMTIFKGDRSRHLPFRINAGPHQQTDCMVFHKVSPSLSSTFPY